MSRHHGTLETSPLIRRKEKNMRRPLVVIEELNGRLQAVYCSTTLIQVVSLGRPPSGRRHADAAHAGQVADSEGQCPSVLIEPRKLEELPAAAQQAVRRAFRQG